MANGRLPWRALRPALLAGAATLTWLTLSGTAAAADSTDSNSLLGGLTASVSALAAPGSGTLPSLPEAAPPASPASAPSGLMQPVVGTLSGTADQLVAAVPVVNTVVPAGTVSAASVPIAAVADEAATGVVETVAPPLVEAVPVLEPVVQPVSDLVTGAAPLPVTLPGVPDGGPLPAASESVLAPTPAAVHASAGDVTSASPGNQLLGLAGDPTAGFRPLPAALARTLASPPVTATALRSADPSLPQTNDESPYAALGGPSSGAGSGSSSSSPSGSAAWLNDFGLDFPLPESFSVSGTSEHTPLPVSFDPGSSPD